ncbi:MAG: threonine synthase [Janthinobacterium lividum]
MVRYLNPRSGETFPLDPPLWRAPDGGPLLLTDIDLAPGALPAPGQDLGAGVWRWRAALPPLASPPITLGEGATPLVAHRIGDAPVWIKGEWANPTGSFKDRGTAVMLSLLRDAGIREILEDSSGNGGASVAAYAAAGGMRATILAPEGTSPAKTLQARAYGARVELVPGDRQATADAALARSGETFYASHAWHPFFLHGTKTLAYELVEQLGRAPDHVVMPCGGGSIVLGCAIAFAEMRRAGLIGATPRLWAAQPEACAPIARAVLRTGDAPPTRPTIAEGTAIARPVRGPEVAAALIASRGGAVMLDEPEIAAATLALARAGLFVEPTCAQATAALSRLLARGAIAPTECTVAVLTGTGLKAAPLLERLLAEQ